MTRSYAEVGETVAPLLKFRNRREFQVTTLFTAYRILLVTSSHLLGTANGTPGAKVHRTLVVTACILGRGVCILTLLSA